MTQNPIRRALVSVSDKSGLVDFVAQLREFDVEIISTGGTAKALEEAGISVRPIEDFTGLAEMLDGRIKTLHHRVHAGLLWRRDEKSHADTVEREGFESIDLVVVNLYPFEATVAKPGVTRAEAIEQIDIGGPGMTRSAAKNHAHVTVIVSPGDYGEVVSQMQANAGATELEFRQRMALKAFRRTAAYDSAIARYLAGQAESPAELELPSSLELQLCRERSLRYGENPHQRAALYGAVLEPFEQLHGKEISYNNILDLMGTKELAENLGELGCAVVIVKHSNPCGAAIGSSVKEAWDKALATDAVSASGGVVVSSQAIDAEAAAAMRGHFIEILVAPDFSAEALELLRNKKNRILLRCPRRLFANESVQLRAVPGGVLAQTSDVGSLAHEPFDVVTERQPTPAELDALRFGWRVVRAVKSNAILFASNDRTLAVGAGQMSRVDSVRVAEMKAAQAGIDLRGAAVASDAFFPFADGLIAAADAGATAVVQPGGSVRDAEVIAAANERNIAMVVTGRRHFRH